MKTCRCGAPATDILKHNVRFEMKLGDWMQVYSKAEPLCPRCYRSAWDECCKECLKSNSEFIFSSESIKKEDR